MKEKIEINEYFFLDVKLEIEHTFIFQHNAVQR